MNRMKKQDNPLVQAAIELTECDIKKFRQCMILLQNPSIPEYKKHELARFVQKVQQAIKQLQNASDEKDFQLFFCFYINKDRRIDVADQFGIAEHSVTRNVQKRLKKLSILLYPELYAY